MGEPAAEPRGEPAASLIYWCRDPCAGCLAAARQADSTVCLRPPVTMDEPAALVDRRELDLLLAVATLYEAAFADNELLTLPGALLLQDVTGILDRHGRRY